MKHLAKQQLATAPEEEHNEPVTEETMHAMHWASNFDQDASVLHLIRSLPPPVVEEKVVAYRKRDTTAVA